MLPKNKSKQARYNIFIWLQKDVCNETKHTIVRVKTCPENETAFNERSQAKQCYRYPKCHGKDLFYHCVRENVDSLVEVCVPNQHIIGKQNKTMKIDFTMFSNSISVMKE